jgi:chromosome segregation ATPase
MAEDVANLIKKVDSNRL